MTKEEMEIAWCVVVSVLALGSFYGVMIYNSWRERHA